MKLAILIGSYLAVELLGLFLLYGPLRKDVDPDHKHPARAVIPILILGILFAFPLIGALLPDGPFCWFFQKWGNILIGYMIYFFSILLIIRLIEMIVRIIRRIRTGEKHPLTRKYSLSVLIFAIIASAAINIIGSGTAHDVNTTFYEVPREVLGQEEPLRIVLIADTHIGVNSTPQMYKDMVEAVNEQDPDLVVVAGDIVTSSYGAMRDPDEYSSMFSQIKAKYGKYVIYGNHDVEEPLLGGFTFVGAENTYRSPYMEQFLEDCDWTLLRDEVIQLPELNGLYIAGRRDESRPGDGVKERATLETLLSENDPDDHIFLLQHEPVELDTLENYGIDLAVSGHTHDGQIFPGNIFCRVKGPQAYGLKKWGDATVIVTSGVGFYGPPIRVGTKSEIVVIDLK